MNALFVAAILVCPPGSNGGPPPGCQDYGPNPHDVCVCSDWNGDSVNDSSDMADFLTDFYAGNPCADVNADGFVDPDDLSDFITNYFQCPWLR